MSLERYSVWPNHPGAWARVKILPEAPQYAQLRAACEGGTLDQREWGFDKDGQLWVSFNVFAFRGKPR